MEKETFTIVNENDQDIVGEVFREKKSGKSSCVIFSHGLLETRKESYIKTLGDKLLKEGYAVIFYDSTQGVGESGGVAADVTISQRVSDLSRVISYAKRRSFIDGDRITVFGHCFGSMAALAMEGFQHELAAAVLVSTPARIEDTFLTRKSSHEMMKIKLKRYFHVRHGDDEEEVRINYSLYEDGMKIDMDRAARNLTTPALFIHGAKDESIAKASSERLYERAKGEKKLVIIDSMAHDIKGVAITKIYNEMIAFLKEHLK